MNMHEQLSSYKPSKHATHALQKKRWSYSRYRFLPGTLCIRNACDIFFKKPLKCLTRRILNFETFCKGSRKFGNSYIFDLSFTVWSVLRNLPLQGIVKKYYKQLQR